MKNGFLIDWSGKAFDYSESEISAVVKVMHNADPLTQGKYLLQFERGFACYNGTPYAFALTNCTNALDLAAILSGLKKGDELIIPAHTFSASAIPFLRTGAKIVWADIDPETRVISESSICKLLTKRTKAILVVHLYGLMANMPGIMEIAKKYNFCIIEDCAQALGAEYNGKKSGSFGDLATFSFHAQKNLTTLGEGGMLVVKDNNLAKKVPGLRHNGVRPYSHKRKHYWIPAMVNVDLDIKGVVPYNFSLTEAQSALGSKVLKRIDKLNSIRIKRAEYFKEALKDFPELSFQKVPAGYKHVYHLLSAKYAGGDFKKNRDDFIKLMAYKYKIKTIVQYYPLYRYPLFKKMGLGKASCPFTDDFFDNMVSFPFHVWMKENDFEYMVASTIKTLKTLRGQKRL